MEGSECPPVTVEGDWTPTQTKALKNKLQLYFQSKKKSGGGDCRVEAEEGAPRAAVYFSSPEERERVLARKNHEIILDSKTIRLQLSLEPNSSRSVDVSDSESPQSTAVVLENVTDNMSTELLTMLVEIISGLDENSFSLEIIRESNRAVITFNNSAAVVKKAQQWLYFLRVLRKYKLNSNLLLTFYRSSIESLLTYCITRFLTDSKTSTKFQKHGLSARPLEAATSVRVESFPPTVVKVVEEICIKKDLKMKSITMKVYPYYESLGTALYGKERPTWKMPEPFTEPVLHVIWKFLVEKKLSEHINDQMRPHFCRMDLNGPDVKLSPLPEFLRQQGLTAEHVNNWMNKAQEAFRCLMSQYTSFECQANALGWTAAEKDVRSVVKEDAILVLDTSKGFLTVAGRADDIKRIRAPVEKILLKAMSLIERQTNSISEEMILSPAIFYVLKQEGLQKTALDISPEMKLSYDEGTQKLTITGLPAEVFKTKAWILERNVNLSKKYQNVPPCLLDFLRTLDPMDMSQDLFASQGINAIYTIDNKGLLLLGNSDLILADAESKMMAALAHQIVNVEDQEVLKLPNWMDLKQQLLDTYNLSKKKRTVAIEIHPERGRKITVAGFVNPVKEVSHSLREFIENYSRVQEFIDVQSSAAVKFIEGKQTEEWSSIAKDNDVSVNFDVKHPRISIAGARLHVQKTKFCFMELLSELFSFEFQANALGWKAAEKDVHSVVKEDAILVLDASKGVLTVAGRADDIKRIRAPVENILLKAMSHIERQTNSISEEMILSPAWFYILKQEGLHKAALDISPEMKLSYDEGTQKLTITGLTAEVFKTKSWILERNVNMSKKHQNVPPCLLDFLRTLDPVDLSQDLFTSQGINATYTIENKGLLLLGSSERALADAESQMMAALTHQIVDVEVLKLPNWMELKQKLLDTYNLSKKKKTVAIEMHPQRRDKITVAGFVDPVKEVSHSLRELRIENYSRVQETLRVQSCAAVQFIEKKRIEEWSSIAKNNNVSVNFYVQKQSISILGARLHVQKAKSCFMELASALFTDTLTVDKPGAKKYFQTQGSIFLSTIMNELRCVILLRPEIEDEGEEENYEEETKLCYCKVQTISGVLISVSKVDICSFGVDAVVNAANEDLDHIGGLALALLKAAGPQLQRESSDYVAKNGRLHPGDAIITDAYNLPCKHVVHAVGPRFSDFDRKTAVSRLKTAVRESLRQAEMANCSSIALPAISSGIFGFPVDLCAETIAQAVREYCDSPQGLRSLTEIHLVDNNDTTVRVMATAVSKEFSDLGPTMTIPQQAGGKRTGASG
nr:PREDICTED: poly [ADP-ribose] polymerase 14-like [Pundamilia nyererei]